MGPQRSTNTCCNAMSALAPLCIFGTGEHICFPRMQLSHFGGDEDRSIGISVTEEWHTMSRIF